jgi:hypothetical protein
VTIVTREQRRSNSFVLRVWWEEVVQPDQWRGWVQHAATGATRYFRQVAELLDFIEAHTGPLTQDPDATSKKREEVM